jgi:repressor LexA
MKQLTPRQKQVLEFIKTYVAEHQYPPTIREIGDYLGISVKGAHDHIRALQKKGVIACDSNRSRAIEILAGGPGDDCALKPATVEVPILGTVAAGVPLLSEENFDGTVTVASDHLRGGAHFALHVTGDSMTGAGIFSGDLAVFTQQSSAENGQIVVAMVDDAVTLKRFYKEKHRVKLKAENEAYPPIYSQNVRVIGRLVHLMRSYA